MVNYAGLTFGRLTVLRRLDKTAGGNQRWECLCCCGNKAIILHGNLQRGHTTSCGCYHAEILTEYNKKKIVSDTTKRKLSLYFKGRPSTRKNFHHSLGTIEKLRAISSGKKPSAETRKRLSDALKGCKSIHWKGGINPINDSIRKSTEHSIWRDEVYKRDDYTCQNCHARGGRLNPHHIKAFSLYPDLRFSVENGVTLCQRCHKELHRTYVPRTVPRLAGMRSYDKTQGNC